MLNKIKKDNKGFTIIEVLIVLAIAGLILLVVFLAVPALQRNSRNTQLKSAVTSVLGGVSEFSANNDGKIPTSAAGTGDIVLSAGSANSVTVKIPKSLTAGTDFVLIPNVKCTGSGSATTAQVRSVAITYKTETSGTPIDQCSDG